MTFGGLSYIHGGMGQLGCASKVDIDSLMTGLLAYWKLDEASGDAIDSSINNRTLTQVNNPLGVVGKVGNARNFVSTSAQHLKNTAFALDDADFTVSFWVNFTTRIAFAALIEKQISNARGQFNIYHESDWKIGFALYQQADVPLGSVISSTFGALSIGTWYHVLADRNKTTGKIGIEVNGTRTEGNAPGVMGTSANFGIGAWAHSAGHPLNGAIDEVGVWSRLLTAEEKARLLNNT